MAATNINLYQENLIINNNHSFQRMGKLGLGKYIYRTKNGKYEIHKQINNKSHHYGTFNDLETARTVRDNLIQNNWIVTDDTYPQEWILEKETEEYYMHIRRNSNKRQYHVCDKYDEYQGAVTKIEEALYYRDICCRSKHKRGTKLNVDDYDLTKDNPYLENGLKYPLPERLKLERKPIKYGMGYVETRGPQSHRVVRSKTYFGSYSTYEEAWYVLQEVRKNGFDKSKLDEILEGYPVWYTWLMKLYRYVIPTDNGKWLLAIPKKYSPENKLEHLRFTNLEDALWERDLYLKYGWDDELVVYNADDTLNPYYDMDLPPYPQRKIRNNKEREPRTELFNQLTGLILEGCTNQEECAYELGMTSATLRNILQNEYDSGWSEFKNIVLGGEDPNEVLELQPLILNVDRGKNYKEYSFCNNYVSHYSGHKSPYTIYYQGTYYGSYPTRELADKISNALQKVGWDKSKLEKIQAKYGHKSVRNSKRWVYPNKRKNKKGEVITYSYSIRRKDKERKMVNYGSYKDYDLACMIRDKLVECDWDISKLTGIREECEQEFKKRE